MVLESWRLNYFRLSIAGEMGGRRVICGQVEFVTGLVMIVVRWHSAAGSTGIAKY